MQHIFSGKKLKVIIFRFLIKWQLDNATPNLTKNYEGQTRHTAWTRRRNFDFTATNKSRQSHGHAGEEPTTTTNATPPTMLTTVIVATEARQPSLLVRHDEATRMSPPHLSLIPLSGKKLLERCPKRYDARHLVRSQGIKVSRELPCIVKRAKTLQRRLLEGSSACWRRRRQPQPQDQIRIFPCNNHP